MRVTFVGKRREAEHIYTFYFWPSRPVQYIAGQYIELFVPHDHPDDRGIQRWFTLSSPPTEDLLSITTRFAGHHSSTFKQALLHLQPGTEVTMAEPMGDFVLPKDTYRPLLFIAGGMGITPFRSIITWLTSQQEQRNITLIYGVHAQEQLIYVELFRQYGAAVHTHVAQTSAARIGLDINDIIEAAGKLDDGLIFIAGPEELTDTLRSQLFAYGIPQERIITDAFLGYTS